MKISFKFPRIKFSISSGVKINKSNIYKQKLNKTKISTHARALLRSTPLSSAKKFLTERGTTSEGVKQNQMTKGYNYCKQEVGPRSKTPSFFACGVLNFFVLFSFCFVPSILFAQIEITEIMYNPGEDADGSTADDGREWIEIYNSDLEKDVNLDGWKLFDNKDGGGHPLSSVIQGSFTIKSRGYLIIADVNDEDDKSTFLTDYPNFSGTVLNSNFGSFNNTAGVFAVDEKDTDILNISWVEYLKEQGANGDGNSLQKVNGIWIASAPTPGEANSQNSQPVEEDPSENTPNDPQDETSLQTPAPTTTSSAIAYKIEPQIFAQIIPPIDTPIAGADFLFEADSSGLQGEPLQNEEYQWAFGDGSKAKGQKVLHNYQYPSDYLAVLEVISGKYSASDRLKIKVIPSDIRISEVGVDFDNGFVELHNPSVYELNLSWWRLRIDNNYFTIPKNTILLPKSRIKFSSKTTNLFPKQNSLVDLLYPNGSVAFHYVKMPILPPPQTQTVSIKSAIQPPPLINQPAEPAYPAGRVDPPQVGENLPLSSTSSSQQTPNPKSNKTPFNKWTVSLAGIVSLAVIGVVFATKLDK